MQKCGKPNIHVIPLSIKGEDLYTVKYGFMSTFDAKFSYKWTLLIQREYSHQMWLTLRHSQLKPSSELFVAIIHIYNNYVPLIAEDF